jgi:hypothetical protein
MPMKIVGLNFFLMYSKPCLACSFPESEVEPFFFDVRADTLPDSVIVDTVVEPPDAKLKIVNIRTNNLPHV